VNIRRRLHKYYEVPSQIAALRAEIYSLGAQLHSTEESLQKAITNAVVTSSGKPDDRVTKLRIRRRLVGPSLGIVSILVIVLAVYSAFQLTRQVGVPPAAGTASLLVTGNPFSPTDRFQLHLVTDDPETQYVEYQVIVGCNTKVKDALLMLSGNARLLQPRLGIGSGFITERTAYVGQPWFSSPQAVQVFDMRISAMRCPVGVSPNEFGAVNSIGGYTQYSFEDTAGSSHALQLPLVGDETTSGVSNYDANIPTLGGFWASPLDLSVSVYAGGLPLYDRIDVVRPGLTGAGDLSWTGTSFIRPSATWTDLTSASRAQFLVLLLGTLIGLFGSAFVTVTLDWIRKVDRRTQ
jgi:hypothetical protein